MAAAAQAVINEPKEERAARMEAAMLLKLPPSQCRFFLQRKLRFCKFEAAPGKPFCTNHGGLDQQHRVQCPHESKQCATRCRVITRDCSCL
jgi:CCCH zinc finger in TRM13 protein